MGQDTAQTVKEIEQTRARLSAELDELEDRLPEAAIWAKRGARMAAGGGVGGSVLWFIVRRARRKRKRAGENEQPDPARPIDVSLSLVPKRVSATLEDERARPWLIAAGAAWVLVRLAEIRQMRRLRRAMLIR